ncbi:MAG: glycosyltransferase family 1 protein [Caldilineaceae bacterium]|nr:glycosyltransferase family 1 protein [Caldilineaceae bacterium]
MRIAIFTETFLPKTDGIVNTLCHLFDHLAARAQDSILFAPDGGPLRYANTAVVGLPGIPFPLYPELKLVPPLVDVSRHLHRFKPDLIHVVNPVSLGLLGLRQARRLGIPAIASYHTDVPGFAARWGLGWCYEPLVRYFRWVHNQADLTLCPSHATLRTLASQGYERLRVWSRGVDEQRFHPRHRSLAWRHRLCEGQVDKPLLLYVGRLSPEKRIDWIQAVLQRLPEARLAIVGDGPARPHLHRVFAGLPVHFTGYLHGHDLACAYAAADVFVFPAANETLGNVVLEAMASGLPVVAPKAGGVQDHVDGGVTGLLFAPESINDLVAAVSYLVRDPNMARRMGERGRQVVENRSWKQILDGLLDDYAAVVQRRARLATRPARRLICGAMKR